MKKSRFTEAQIIGVLRMHAAAASAVPGGVGRVIGGSGGCGVVEESAPPRLRHARREQRHVSEAPPDDHGHHEV